MQYRYYRYIFVFRNLAILEAKSNGNKHPYKNGYQEPITDTHYRIQHSGGQEFWNSPVLPFLEHISERVPTMF